MRKELHELSTLELRKVFKLNKKLHESIYFRYYEDEIFWIKEQVEKLSDSLSDWEIGRQNVYLTVETGKELDFMEGVLRLQEEYVTFTISDMEKVQEIYDIVQKCYECDVMDKDFDKLQEKMADGIDKIADMLGEQWSETLEYDSKTLEEYFVDYYIDSELSDGTFFVDTDTYELYEEVYFVKGYMY